MNTEIITKKHRREPLELQLTAMIDVFSMIVIFLIFGTVFGASEMVVPKNMVLPLTQSKEGVESAGRLVISPDQVDVSMIKRSYPIDMFRAGGDPEGKKIPNLKIQLKAVVDSLPATAKTSGTLLNVIADKNAPYKDVFDVIRVFRESGYDTLLFVATGDGSKSPDGAKK